MRARIGFLYFVRQDFEALVLELPGVRVRAGAAEQGATKDHDVSVGCGVRLFGPIIAVAAVLPALLIPSLASAQTANAVSAVAGLAPAPASATAAPNAAPAPGALKPYRINPGDEIEIYVWGDERLQRVLKVLPDGSVSFPLVGRIDALNKLPTDLEGVIAAGLSDQYRNSVPRVTVSVKNPSGLSFSVAGKVRQPGAFQPGHYVNVLEAISVAGGPTEFADLSRVKIYRKQGAQIQVIDVRLDTAMKGSPSQTDLRGAIIELQSGDTVVVP
ncbi:polysaccharide biosynthesis/export family protein [Rhizorhabdus sp.]|uniref:polysaccharide biosynthesis/export family protein n=1 Tax=Rhizorhabdus sp. TaxID=1968843 RepID=UPI0025E84EC4|nr:polysaccharide biosynthesis/export family protein [Rhizorhabdus sp.]